MRNGISVSSPFITGISMSSVTTSGRSASILASASRPLLAVPTTSQDGSDCTASLTRRRMTAESSVTSTRIRVPGLPRSAYGDAAAA